MYHNPGTAERIALGLPGVYRQIPQSVRQMPKTRMDITAFVGLADRGPAYQPSLETGEMDDWQLVLPGRPLERSVPVFVESFDEFQSIFGRGSGPGFLTDSVKAYFEQGGFKAAVVRILPVDPNRGLHTDCARGIMPGFTDVSPSLFARNCGSWGANLRASLRFRQTRITPIDETGNASQVAFDSSVVIQVGDHLLFRRTSGASTSGASTSAAKLARVVSVDIGPRGRLPGKRRLATLDQAVGGVGAFVDLIEAEVTIEDGMGIVETHRALGCSPDHTRWFATVLARESQLVWPHQSWASSVITPNVDAVLDGRSRSCQFAGGSDQSTMAVTSDDMFDLRWTLGNPSSDGIQSLLPFDDVTHLCVPDLYSPRTAQPAEPVPQNFPASGTFSDCIDMPSKIAVLNHIPSPRALDSTLYADRERIVELQQKVVDFCESTGQFIALLDAPLGLRAREIMEWRGNFTSAWAAVYAPWCMMIRRDNLDITNRLVPPSAVAAGIIAASEVRSGVPRGPAQQIALEIVDLADRLPTVELGPLHQSGVNIFHPIADGIRLAGARTTSRIFQERQLSVRRMLLKLRRMLFKGMQWAVFEPNGQDLWQQVEIMLDTVLRQEWRAGSFAGATVAQSYFISIDKSQRRLDRGELYVEVGVALVEPLEFIVIRLVRDGDGTLQLEDQP